MKITQLQDRRIVIVILGVLAAATLACGAAPTPTATPLPAPTDAPTAEPEASVPSLDVVNDSTTPVCYVYISPTKSDEWGPDQLGEENMIDGGASFTLTDIPAGTYDLKAEDCSGNLLGILYDADINEGQYTWTIETVTLTVENNSTSIGCKVFIAPANSEEWGMSWTPEGTQIMPNETFELGGVPAGIYALRVETCSGNYFWEWAEFDLTEDTSAELSN
jgi:hypothetical protein